LHKITSLVFVQSGAKFDSSWFYYFRLW